MWNGAAVSHRPEFRKRLCIRAPAFKARPVARGERGHLIEKEQFGIAVAPDPATAPFELQHTADPLPRGPAAFAQGLVGAVETSTTISKQYPARRRRNQLAE